MINAQGIDTSLWDGGPDDNRQVINFSQYKSAFPFVIIKVSEGLVKDPLFDRQWAAAKGEVIRSPYHFWRSFVDQKIAVQKMMGWLGNDAGMEVSLDAEATNSSTSVMSLMKIWTDEYHRLSGKWPIIYSTRSFLFENGASKKTIFGAYKNAWLTNCKLWLAEYLFDELNSMPGYTETGDALRKILINQVIDSVRQLSWPKPVEPFKQVELYQWTSRYPPEKIPGYFNGLYHKEAVDANFHILTRSQLEAQYPVSSGGTVPPSSSVTHTLNVYSNGEVKNGTI